MKIKGNPQQGLLGATMGFFAGFAAVALFGPTASKFNEVMQLSPLMIGFLVAIPSLSGSLLRIPFGAWVDTNGGRKPFLILMWLSLLGMLGLLLVVTYWYPQRMSANMFPILLLLGALSGCGIATFSVGIGQVSYWFPQEKQGAALGAYAGLGNLAPGLFSFLLPVALQNWGLQTAYLAWLVFLGAGVIFYQWAGLNSPYFQALNQLQQGGESGRKLARDTAQADQQLADTISPDRDSRQTASQLAIEIAKEHGQQIFPKGNAQQSLAAAARPEQDLDAGCDLFHHLRRFHCSDSLVSDLLERVVWVRCADCWQPDCPVFDKRFARACSRWTLGGSSGWRADSRAGLDGYPGRRYIAQPFKSCSDERHGDAFDGIGDGR